jgi:predicted nucleic acid-binding protein
MIMLEDFGDSWRTAGRLKAIYKRVSLADCFAIALAQSLGGTVLTCDHHEFDAIAAANLCAVTFIR